MTVSSKTREGRAVWSSWEEPRSRVMNWFYSVSTLTEREGEKGTYAIRADIEIGR